MSIMWIHRGIVTASCVAAASIALGSEIHVIAPSGAPYNRGQAITCFTNAGEAIGYDRFFSNSARPFSWSPSGGKLVMGLGLMQSNYIWSCSADGAIMVGDAVGPYSPTVPAARTAVVRSRTGDIQLLGIANRYAGSYATDVSADGRTAVGVSFRYDANNPIEYTQAIPFIWTSESGRIDLPHAVVGGQYGYTGFNAISADGSTAVGAYGVDGVGRAFRWTSLGGYQFLSSPVGASGAFQASDISADGAIIVGMSGSLNTSTTLAAYWDRSGAGHILESTWTQMGAQRCNADGSLITGMGLPSMGVSQAWVWTQADGVVAAADYFRRNGVDIPAGYTIDGINAVSPDGRSFGGVALSADRRNASTFIATVPTPSVGAVLTLCCFAAKRRRANPSAKSGSNPN